MAPKKGKRAAEQQDEADPGAPLPKKSKADRRSIPLITPQPPQRPYCLSAPIPTRKPRSKEFTFAHCPAAEAFGFHPNVSPEEMRESGVASLGSYFRPYYSKVLKTEFHEDWSDLPDAWTAGLDVDRYLLQSEYDPEVCQWKVKVGQSIEEWEKAKWIVHEHDVRGWFQWYCRFYLGRRCEDDERQIKRWSGVAGRNGRWRKILLQKYHAAKATEVSPTEEMVSPAIRQTLLHWALDVNTTHLNLFKLDKGIRIPNPGDSQDEAESDHEAEARARKGLQAL